MLFLCWLLEWADPKYRHLDMDLHNVGTHFMRAIFEKHQQPLIKIESVDIERQLDGLDVLAVLN